ncbi:MAG: acetaldehyde dehydrogenase (acetylating) [Spirochaetes bacterium]|nr:acetaldehyde dehydrogenase (acetylating) [Spirochaetota bacterium]
MLYDNDLLSIQDVREMMKKARQAQKDLQSYSQKQIDAIIKTITDSCIENAEKLAKMAVEETGFGIWQDKVLKNLLGSKMVYESIKDLKTVGILTDDKNRKIMEIAVPVGIVAALIPSTNPTSTSMFKALISIKSGNAIIISPHPGAKNCIIETVRIMQAAAKKAGAPENIIQCIEKTTMEATNELMKHKDTDLILATGGGPMVKAAYSSGNPAIGVGAGNGPAYIEASANIKLAVKRILDSKTFDNGTICASEQSVVTEAKIKDAVISEMTAQGAYFLNEEQSDKVAKILMRANNTMNPAIVGKSTEFIAKLAGIQIPKGTRVLVSMQTEVSPRNPYSREKLCPVLGFYVEENWEKACLRCIEILENEGVGHTMVIHSENQNVITEFALKKPVGRLLVNTPAALGAVGVTTNLLPSLTLGCGSMGGSSTFDNVGPMNLINIRRIAYGVKELEDLGGGGKLADAAVSAAAARQDAEPAGSFGISDAPVVSEIRREIAGSLPLAGELTESDIERITKEVLKNILNNNSPK